MREHRYRAFDKTENVIIDVVEMHFGSDGIDVAVWDGENIARLLKPSQYVLLEYTGLKDKNGVEIYTDDIFKVIYSDTPNGFTPISKDKTTVEVFGVVVYKWSGFYVKHEHPLSKELVYGGLYRFLENPKEIIGSIHTHPELTREKE